MWTLGGHHFGKSYFCGRPYFESNGHEARSSCIRKPTSRRKKPRRDTVVPEENNRTNAPRKLINKPVKLTQSAEIDISNPQLEGSCLSEKAKPRDKYCERDCLRIYESGRDSREKHSASDIASILPGHKQGREKNQYLMSPCQGRRCGNSGIHQASWTLW